jgi:hypothetical protein
MNSTNAIYDLTVMSGHPLANTVEWYFLPNITDLKDPNAWHIEMSYSRPQFPSIRFRNPQVLEEYRYKELLYVYDRSNDGQRTVFRQALQEDVSADGKIYRLVLQEDTLPSHRFPCSLEVHKNDSIVRRSFKINNRLHLLEDCIHDDTYQYYLRFHYAPNVDMAKMQQDLEGFIRGL